jgi:glycosyltransferase involved in cell wall biosynthesis
MCQSSQTFADPGLDSHAAARSGAARRHHNRQGTVVLTLASALAILHVLRAPVGGLFRHVLDLAQGQVARGHRVGIMAADSGGSAQDEERLRALAPGLRLGVHRIPMARQLGLGDFAALRRVAALIAETAPQVVHGHGAKGGAYARLARTGPAIRVYTPHGGSLHYARFTARGVVYGTAERIMMARTDLALFESEFARDAYRRMIGTPRCITRVIHNGIRVDEMVPVEPSAGAADLVFVGELRPLKGPDVLLEAMAQLRGRGRPLTAAIAGDGAEREALRRQAERAGLADSVRFLGHCPARQAFALGRILVVPSRAESLPYIVLEALGAGLPVIATRVGGIPEIFGPEDEAALVPPGDAQSLAAAVAAALDDPAAARARAALLGRRIRERFSQDAMVDGILAAYGEAIRAKFTQSH